SRCRKGRRALGWIFPNRLAESSAFGLGRKEEPPAAGPGPAPPGQGGIERGPAPARAQPERLLSRGANRARTDGTAPRSRRPRHREPPPEYLALPGWRGYDIGTRGRAEYRDSGSQRQRRWIGPLPSRARYSTDFDRDVLVYATPKPVARRRRVRI